jgi:hypothetical protein
MSGEPSSSELAAFTSLYDVACCSGLAGEHDDPTEPFGSLLMLLGATWDMPPHTIGMVTEAGFDLAIAAWIATLVDVAMWSGLSDQHCRLAKPRCGV